MSRAPDLIDACEQVIRQDHCRCHIEAEINAVFSFQCDVGVVVIILAGLLGYISNLGIQCSFRSHKLQNARYNVVTVFIESKRAKISNTYMARRGIVIQL